MILFFRCSKILGEAFKQDILQQMFDNSRSQIVFRTDIFRKLTLGAPVLLGLGSLTLFSVTMSIK